MHPALSVVVFTALSGAGYGLLFWVGAWLVADHARGEPPLGERLALFVALDLFGLLLVTAGLFSSLAHLGKPQRAWRAVSQWRTSWLSREGVSALISYLPPAALATLAVAGALYGPAQRWLQTAVVPLLGLAAMLCAVVTVVCTAMIYASLKPIPAWHHRLVVPAYLLFAVLCGGALLAAALALAGLDAYDARWLAIGLAALAIATGLVKAAYWRAIDRQALPATRGDAVGLPGRTLEVFEHPHTQDTFITREMAFVLARKHARRLRAIALALFAAAPVGLALLAAALPAATALLFPVAALCALAGALVERWLFFAEARHVVTLYY